MRTLSDLHLILWIALVCHGCAARRPNPENVAAIGGTGVTEGSADGFVCEQTQSNILFSFDENSGALDRQNVALFAHFERELRSVEGTPTHFRVISNVSHCEAQAGADVEALLAARARDVQDHLARVFPSVSSTAAPVGVTEGGCPCDGGGFCCIAQRWASLEVTFCRPPGGPLPPGLSIPAERPPGTEEDHDTRGELNSAP